MQTVEALRVSHILHNWNVHVLHTAGGQWGIADGVGIFPGLHPTFFPGAARQDED